MEEASAVRPVECEAEGRRWIAARCSPVLPARRSTISLCIARTTRSARTCEECFERLDVYVELELSGEDAEERVPGMRAHLEGCPACSEEHDSLRDLIASQTGDVR